MKNQERERQRSLWKYCVDQMVVKCAARGYKTDSKSSWFYYYNYSPSSAKLQKFYCSCKLLLSENPKYKGMTV